MKNIKLLKNFFLYIKSFSDKKIDISQRPIPCVGCGACCAYFKVTFDNKGNEHVPKHKIIPINKTTSAMPGAEKFRGRCNQLVGEIGTKALCGMYEERPNVCRAFPVWLDNGKQNPRCIKARIFHGLPGKIEY